MSAWTPESTETTFRQVKERAKQDPRFRQLALEDPRAAIEQINPTPIPDDLQFHFVENDSKTLSVNFPDISMGEGELSDAELDSVAGGKMSGSDPRKDQSDA